MARSGSCLPLQWWQGCRLLTPTKARNRHPVFCSTGRFCSAGKDLQGRCGQARQGHEAMSQEEPVTVLDRQRPSRRSTKQVRLLLHLPTCDLLWATPSRILVDVVKGVLADRGGDGVTTSRSGIGSSWGVGTKLPYRATTATLTGLLLGTLE